MHPEPVTAGIAPAAIKPHTYSRGMWFYGFFFVSGFCSILYELVCLRLATAQFG
jgi:hypothetical protein